MIALHGVQFGEDFCIFCCNVSDRQLEWGVCDLYLSHLTYLFSRNRSTHIRIYTISVLFWSNDNWGTPFCGLSDWGDDALALKQLQLSLEFVPICEGDCKTSLGFGFGFDIWNCSPSMVLISLSNADGNSPMIYSDMGVCFMCGRSKSALMEVGFE